MDWFGLGYGLLESPCKFSIELPGFISSWVTYLTIVVMFVTQTFKSSLAIYE